MKSAVQAELTIPVQTRYVFPIYLGRVERHVSSVPIFLTELIYIYICIYFSGLRRKFGEGSIESWPRRAWRSHFSERGCRRSTFAHLAEKTSPNMHPSPSWTAAETRRQVVQVRSLEDHEAGS